MMKVEGTMGFALSSKNKAIKNIKEGQGKKKGQSLLIQ